MSKYKVGSNQFQLRLKLDESALPTESKQKILLKVIYFAILLLAVYDLTVFLSPTQSEASENVNQGVSQKAIDPAESMGAEATIATPPATLKPLTREQKVKTYLEKFNSPLAPHADYIVELADKYDIAYTTIPAIARKESTLGKAIKPGSHNAWGIMSWDSQKNRSIRIFNSWEEGIRYTTALISKNYREQMWSKVQDKYCPDYECSDTWIKTVVQTQEEINSL